MARPVYIAVIGGSEISAELAELARQVGREVARQGAVLLCGGLGGVMAAAAQGAKAAGGVSLGILPDGDHRGANPYLTYSIATNLGHARNMLIAHSADAVIAVDVGSSSLTASRRIREKGFASIYMRSAQVMMRSLQQLQLAAWSGPPMLLMRPAVWPFGWFSFAHTRAMIDAGYAAACEALDNVGDTLYGSGGVFPRRKVEVSVDGAKCIGCGICATLAPDVMQMGPDGKAHVVAGELEWSRPDGDFVNECPVQAFSVMATERDGRRHTTMEFKVVAD